MSLLHNDSIDPRFAISHPEMNTIFSDSSSASSSANSNKNNQNETFEDQKSPDHGEISVDPGMKCRNSTQDERNSGGIWGFQTLVKSLGSKSEGIIKTYRRDLGEFGTGLMKETEALKDLATRAVKSLQKEETVDKEETGYRFSYSSGVKNAVQPKVREDSPLKTGESSVKASNCSKSDRMKNDGEDEDGWGDAVEDSSGIDSVKKQSAPGNSQVQGSKVVDIRKIMSAAAEDDEDLSWDFDEDKDDAKSDENH